MECVELSIEGMIEKSKLDLDLLLAHASMSLEEL